MNDVTLAWPGCPVCARAVLPRERALPRWLRLPGVGVWLVTVHAECGR